MFVANFLRTSIVPNLESDVKNHLTTSALRKIAIIINSFNRFTLLRECLAALDGWISNISDFQCEVYVFDAGSEDGSLDFLYARASGDPHFHVLTPAPGKNRSIAGGFNAGASAALDESPAATHLLFYETDNAIPDPEPVRAALAELDARNNLAACGFTVRRHDGRPAGVGMPFPTLRAFLAGNRISHFLQMERIPYHWENSAGGKFSFVDVVFTSPLLVKAEAWKDTAGMDAETFPFSDCDVDWAKRVALRGWKMGVVERSDVVHDNRNALSDWSKNRALNFHRGRLRYFRRYRPVAVLTVWPLALLVRHCIEWIGNQLFVRNKERRIRLNDQFSGLLHSCLQGYN
jgi:GT2 family glycosyltransferase